jgi:DNA-binding NarL/FixJ family response regulator
MAPAPELRKEAARSLTKREMEIVLLVAQGLKNKVIADRLSIAERTVKNHLQSIFYKLNVSNRLELAVHAIQNKLGSS